MRISALQTNIICHIQRNDQKRKITNKQEQKLYSKKCEMFFLND